MQIVQEPFFSRHRDPEKVLQEVFEHTNSSKNRI